ncbi:ras and EF-hand domain-containing protein homolog isoform X1 [Denticeps clupeoides]|uniref:EF-hand domain-containing protein n=1 Tax=Denticeps clupeoides TaxID=299321 RepID=A0A8C4CR11_9TELE|nr:ras and EF-hand domain-containing protein homolog isoform X1 [Denticeps clupeoides]
MELNSSSSGRDNVLLDNKLSQERRGPDLSLTPMLEKTREFFQTCDLEAKGYITRTDMRRLDRELPLSAGELEDVFDLLDMDKNGFLTLCEFSTGLGVFLHGRRISVAEETLYESQCEEVVMGDAEDEERHFSMLLESLGAISIFEDPEEVRSLWMQLRRDEPHLLANFEEFLARVTTQIKEARQEKTEMEKALKRKAATHDTEIRRLYEEMEQQIKNEKDKINFKDSERLLSRSQDLQGQLSNKEKELDQLFLKQKWLERQCQELHTERQESRVENVKLKMTNEELRHELEQTAHALTLTQEHLSILQEKAARLQQERDLEMYRVTEGLQREKQSLMKQLDLLREMNKNLRDEQDMSSLKTKGSIKALSRKQRVSSLKRLDRIRTVKSEGDLDEEETQNSNRNSPSLVNGRPSLSAKVADGKRQKGVRPSLWDTVSEASGGERSSETGGDVFDSPLNGWPLCRVISIEEDHLPHLLQGEPPPLLHQLNQGGEEAGEVQEKGSPAQLSVQTKSSSMQIKKKSDQGEKGPSGARGQPVGKEILQQETLESSVLVPDRLFKVILVGNSSVGKTALLRRFCDGRFQPSTLATVGVDYSVRTLNLGDIYVALQLWDTAGQERYRSITHQFFRRVDGVVVIYDITMAESFQAVRSWLTSIQEAVGDHIPIMLLGNKMDKDSERQVSLAHGQKLSAETQLMFYEVSAFSGENVMESLTHLARALRETEDLEKEKTVQLGAQPGKKRSCCK